MSNVSKHPIAIVLLLLSFVAATLSAPSARAADAVYPQASRIVSIGGSITEIIYALGAEGQLAARDSTSMFPAQAEALPDVGYMRALSPEGVLSANPDLILMEQNSGPPEALEALRAAGVPLITLPDDYSAEGIVTKIRAIGRVIGEETKAEELAVEVNAQLDAVRKQIAGTEGKKKVMFIISMRGGKIMASGEDTAASSIIALAGGENAISGYTGYKQLVDESVINAAPEVILMMDRRGDHAAGNAELFSHPAIASTPAAKGEHVIRMNGLYLLGFGPRTAEAIRELHTRIYAD